MEIIKSSEKAARLASRRVRVVRDSSPEAPWDMTDSPLVYFSPEYACDRKAHDVPRVETDDETDGDEQGQPEDGYLCAVVLAYEHGGVAVSTRPMLPACGPCGCVWCKKEDFEKYYGKGVNFDEVAYDYVREVNAYYNGEVYGVISEEWDEGAREWKHVDSCYGFYPCETNEKTLEYITDVFVHDGDVVCVDDELAYML